MTRQNVQERCRRISAGYNENSVCRFADNGGLLGFIDTSQGQNGTRGIAFSDNGVLMNFDGDPIEIPYKMIKSVQIISSFEDFFADELSVVYSDTHSDREIRISDFSLDKSELKRLLDGFCGEDQVEKQSAASEKTDASKNQGDFPKNGINPPKNLGNIPQNLGKILQDPTAQNRHSNATVSEMNSRADNTVFQNLTAKIISNNGRGAVSAASGAEHRPNGYEDQSRANVSENMATKNSPDNGLSAVNTAARVEPRRNGYENPSRVNTSESLASKIGSGNGRGAVNAAQASESQANTYNNLNNEIPPIFRRHDDFVDIVFEDRAPVITETVLPHSGTRTPVIEGRRSAQMTAPNPAYNNSGAAQQPPADRSSDLYEDEAAERIRIQNMSPEETLSFLAQSLNEINAPMPEPTTFARQPEYSRPLEMVRQESAPPAPVQAQTVPQNQPVQRINTEHSAVREQTKSAPLTVEPIWGDIYIKASRNLRELCESGRLSMSQIETELDNKLLDSARAFAEITADESKVPKVLIPKITELKAAAKNFDQYFQSGEDIAVRAMFFMMYQMLSYADRIVETPETKERLNDFFRRFGPAGITLSMLDMRV